jgi:hypothetical protein
MRVLLTKESVEALLPNFLTLVASVHHVFKIRGHHYITTNPSEVGRSYNQVYKDLWKSCMPKAQYDSIL